MERSNRPEVMRDRPLEVPPAVETYERPVYQVNGEADRGTPPIGVRVLIIAGDQDTTTLPDASAYMQASIPGAQRTTLTPAKHQGLLEHHGPFAQRVVAFCDACLCPGKASL